jgi:signal transduction histidine kinase
MNLFSAIRPANWTRLSNGNIEKTDDLRRDILFSQILVIGLIISVLHFLNDLINFNTAAFVIDLVFVILLAVFYILNERGAHRLAKFLDLTMLNLLIFLLAAILDEKIRMSYNFFPLAILAFLVFYKSEVYLSILFSVISMGFLITLELTDYKPFGNIVLKQGVDVVTLIINILGSFILMVMGLYFLVRLNLMAENELIQKESDLKKINEELDRFVYSASHDLRSPLSSVKGLANLMRYETKNANLIEYIDKIEHRIKDLEIFIEEIIEFSRNARIHIAHEKIDLRELFDELFEKLKYMDKADEMDFRKRIDLAEIATDKARLSVIILNLVANSIKYADDAKKQKWVEVSVQQQKGAIHIEVKDNGIGVSKKHHKDIFNMFYRAHNNSQGSGLGLYIVKETVKKLNGDIFINSEPEVGTTFTIKLPILHFSE